jgi:hypothetical protein
MIAALVAIIGLTRALIAARDARSVLSLGILFLQLIHA